MKRFGLLVVLSLFVVNIATAAKMYKCQDEEGNIEYTQTPSAECMEEVHPSIQAISSDTPTHSKPAPKTESTTTPSQQQTTLKEDCQRARDNLAALNKEGNIVQMPDKDNPGEFITLTDEMREQNREKAQAYVDKYCVGVESSSNEAEEE